MAVRELNGMKKWLIAIITTLGLSWVGWVSAAVVESKQAEVHVRDVDDRLNRIEQKLDTLLSR